MSLWSENPGEGPNKREEEWRRRPKEQRGYRDDERLFILQKSKICLPMAFGLEFEAESFLLLPRNRENKALGNNPKILEGRSGLLRASWAGISQGSKHCPTNRRFQGLAPVEDFRSTHILFRMILVDETAKHILVFKELDDLPSSRQEVNLFHFIPNWFTSSGNSGFHSAQQKMKMVRKHYRIWVKAKVQLLALAQVQGTRTSERVPATVQEAETRSDEEAEGHFLPIPNPIRSLTTFARIEGSAEPIALIRLFALKTIVGWWLPEQLGRRGGDDVSKQ
ncbi:hypothetical protein MUK42_35175 [Musa troglodytarum]|uniref:Uncharacterized protein n=1 Tax=Musa troglodytarum TaxID=320322 RepID=A0A9E7L0T6_9LILI|nr:hypothetical protein MUK42_35175 [Musa troglodytarum]